MTPLRHLVVFPVYPIVPLPPVSMVYLPGLENVYYVTPLNPRLYTSVFGCMAIQGGFLQLSERMSRNRVLLREVFLVLFLSRLALESYAVRERVQSFLSFLPLGQLL